MGLVRTALIFGAGYVVGHPAGRAKMAELARRPEVAQLRQKVVDTASTGVETGKKQLAKATDRSGSGTSDNGSLPTGGVDASTSTGRWSGRRLPSFPRRGTRPSPGTATTPVVRDGPVTGPATPPSQPLDPEKSGWSQGEE
jgi:hypothetical protein